MEVNIEQIMDEIRAEIQEKGLKNEIPSMEELSDTRKIMDGWGCFSKRQFVQDWERMNHMRIEYYRGLDSSKRWIRFLVLGFKKGFRKAGCFLIKPVLDDINYYHTLVARGFGHIGSYISENELLKERVKKLEREVDDLLHQEHAGGKL